MGNRPFTGVKYEKDSSGYYGKFTYENGELHGECMVHKNGNPYIYGGYNYGRAYCDVVWNDNGTIKSYKDFETDDIMSFDGIHISTIENIRNGYVIKVFLNNPRQLIKWYYMIGDKKNPTGGFDISRRYHGWKVLNRLVAEKKHRYLTKKLSNRMRLRMDYLPIILGYLPDREIKRIFREIDFDNNSAKLNCCRITN